MMMQKFYNEDFIQKLDYLEDIFLKKLSNLNKSIQIPQINTLIQNDKVTVLMKKVTTMEKKHIT
jgi:hypothetical protein